jgi:hypothetical protein
VKEAHSLLPPVSLSCVIHIYLVISGIKFGKDNAINEPRAIELDLEREKKAA